MKNQLFLLLSFFILHQSMAQVPEVTLDKNKILIGEQIKLELKASFSGQPVTWFTLDSFPHFEIMDRSRVDTTRNGEQTSLKQTLTITSWDSGQWQIPALTLGKYQTKPVVVSVDFSKMDYNQPYHDIKDILSVKKPSESNWYWYFILLVILAALFLLFFPMGKKKEKPSFVPDEGAYKKALKKLEQLKERTGTDNKVLYTELIQVFREYLEKKKNIWSYSKTTDDLALQIHNLGLPADEYRELVQTLRLSDLVKFAQFQTSREENKKAIEVVQQNITAIEQLN